MGLHDGVRTLEVVVTDANVGGLGCLTVAVSSSSSSSVVAVSMICNESGSLSRDKSELY